MGGFTYELGEKVLPLGELSELNACGPLIESLKKGGFDKIAESNLTAFQLIEKSIRRFVLQQDVISPDAIDAVIFATSSLEFANHPAHSALGAFLVRAGLRNAYPILSSLSFCGNFLPAINTARCYVAAETFKNVLVVVGDIIQKKQSKLTPPSVAIGSDASACCLVSRCPVFPLQMDGVFFRADSKAGVLDPDRDFLSYTKLVGNGIRNVVEKTFANSVIGKHELSKVFTNNYSRNVCRSFLKLVGIEETLLFDKNIPRFGHAGSADICINVCDYMAEKRTSENESFLLLSTGPFMWSSTLVYSNL